MEKCPPGARLTRGGYCRPCPEGTFLIDNVCKICEGNSVSTVEGSAECYPCDEDDSPLSNKRGCRRRCPVGQFRDEDGTCVHCPIGHIRPKGQPKCMLCPDDTFPNIVGNRCVKEGDPTGFAGCGAGFFVIGRGPDRGCQQCPENEVTTGRGLPRRCNPCTDGKIANDDQSACIKPEPQLRMETPVLPDLNASTTEAASTTAAPATTVSTQEGTRRLGHSSGFRLW